MTESTDNLHTNQQKPAFDKSDKTLRIAGMFGIVIITIWLIVWLYSFTDDTPDFGELPDTASYTDVKAMKADFYDYLQPIVGFHNDRIELQRKQLQDLYARLQQANKLDSDDRDFIIALADQYDYELPEGLDAEINHSLNTHVLSTVYRELLPRVDIVPVGLALVQAAKESGWGRSRFAKEGYNLFGQWCYKPGCGFVPRNRIAGAKHEVKAFDSVADAVASYMNNLNSHHKYATLRSIRANLRSSGKPITGLSLADGLLYYSERRQAYVDEVKSMIRSYHAFNTKPQTNEQSSQQAN